jgi:hypothetical protein
VWQADPPPTRRAASEVAEQVIRDTRRKATRLIAPVAVTVAIGGWMTARALQSGRVDDVVLAMEAWLFIGAVWIGSLWIERGTWPRLGNSTGAFLDLAIRRIESTVKAIRFGLAMYAIQLTAVLWWKAYYDGVGPGTLLTSPAAVLLGWIGLPSLICLSVWYTRMKTTELHRLTELREEWRRE